MNSILTVSPKGQITLPVKTRRDLPYKNFQLSQVGKSLILKPVEIKVIDETNTEVELHNFHLLSESTFDFWNNPDDDVYQSFYEKTNA